MRETFALVHRERPGDAARLLCDLADAGIRPPEPLLRQALGPAPSRRTMDQLARYLPSDLLLRPAARNPVDAAADWARALVHLASGLSDPQLRAVIQVVSRAGDKEERIQFLTDLAEYLPPDLIGNAAAAVPADAAPWGLAVLLAMLAVRASDDQRPSLFKRAHDAAASERFPRTAFQPLIAEATDAGQLLNALQLAGSLRWQGWERPSAAGSRISPESRTSSYDALWTSHATWTTRALGRMPGGARRPRRSNRASQRPQGRRRSGAAFPSPQRRPVHLSPRTERRGPPRPQPARLPLSPETASAVTSGEASMDTIEVELEALAYATMKRNRHARSASGRLLLAVAALLPAAIRTRWCEEWLAELHTLPARRDRVRFAIHTAFGIPQLAFTVRMPAWGHRRSG